MTSKYIAISTLLIIFSILGSNNSVQQHHVYGQQNWQEITRFGGGEIIDVYPNHDNTIVAVETFVGIYFYDTGTYELLWIMDNNTVISLYDFVWSESASQFGVLTDDYQLAIYNGQDGSVRQKHHLEVARLFDIAWSSDLNQVALETPNCEIQIWDLTTEEQVSILPTCANLYDTSWSPDGIRLAVSNDESNSVEIWNTSTNLFEFSVALNAISEWHSTGNYLAIYSRTAEGFVIDIETKETLVELGKVNYLEFDNNFQVAFSRRSGFELYEFGIANIMSGNVTVLHTTTNPFCCSSWSENYTYLATNGADFVYIWATVLSEDLEISLVHQFPIDANNPNNLFWNQLNTEVFVAVRSKGITALNLKSQLATQVFPTTENLGALVSIAWLPSGDGMVAGGRRTLVSADLETENLTILIEDKNINITSVEVLINDQILFNTLQGEINLLASSDDVVSINPKLANCENVGRDNQIALSPDETNFAFIDMSNTINIMRLTPTEEDIELAVQLPLLTFRFPEIVCGSVISWSPDGQWLAIGGDPNYTLYLYNIEKEELHEIDSARPAIILDIVWSPNSIYLSFMYEDDLSIWDVRNLIEVMQIDVDYERIGALDWSPDGQYLAGSRRGISHHYIYIWDVISGTKIATLEGHSGLITDLKWSPDGQYLASVGHDGTIRIWGQ